MENARQGEGMQAKRVAIYLRVSTQDQSTELQASELRTYAQARGWTDLKVYEDKATGTTGNRPALKQLLQDVRQRRVDLVLCWKLDRLFRSLKDLIGTLQEFQDLGVQFCSLKDSIDMTTSAGRLLMHLLGAFGEFEASLIRERVRAGLANAKAKGKRLGRPKTRDDLAIHDLRQRGFSIRQIAKATGTSTTSVQRALRVT
jgi:putative DNA-invertase from lambdoid prophage Rac